MLKFKNYTGKMLYKNKKENKIDILSNNFIPEEDYDSIMESLEKVMPGNFYGKIVRYHDVDIKTPSGEGRNKCTKAEVWIKVEGERPHVLKGLFEDSIEQISESFNKIDTWNGKKITNITRKKARQIIR